MSMLQSQAGVVPAFDQFATSYDQATPIQSEVALLFAKQIVSSFCQANVSGQRELSDSKNCVVIDVGCGTGKLTQAVVSAFFNNLHNNQPVVMYGVDNAANMLKQWQQTLQVDNYQENTQDSGQGNSQILQCHAVLSPMQQIALEDKIADIVMSSFAVHWTSPAVIDELGRLVKTGGQLHLAIPVKGSLSEVSARFDELPIFEFFDSTAWQRAIEQLMQKRKGKLLYQYEQQFFYAYENLPQLLKNLKQMGGAVSGQQPIAAAKLRSYLTNPSPVNLDYQMLMIGVSL